MTKLITYLLPVVATVLLHACADDVNFPLPNRCGDRDVMVFESHEYDVLFGSAIGSLAAGEISGSLAVPGSKTLWFINNARLNTSAGEQHIDNCIVSQNGTEIKVYHGMENGSPGSLIPGPDTAHWYSINSGIISNGNCELVLSLWERIGAGPYDYAHTGTAIAVVGAADMRVQNVVPRIDSSDILFGAALLQDGDYTYIYGAQNNWLTKELYVARVPSGSLLQPWEFSDKGEWRADLADAATVMNNVSDRFSVFKAGNQYYLMSQASLFSQEVVLYQSGEPAIGWWKNKTLYCRFVSDDTRMTANTLVHTLKNNDERLVCSYVLVDKDLTTGKIHRPEFIEITGWR